MNPIEQQNHINQQHSRPYTTQEQRQLFWITLFMWVVVGIVEVIAVFFSIAFKFKEWRDIRRWRKRMRDYADTNPEALLERCWKMEPMGMER